MTTSIPEGTRKRETRAEYNGRAIARYRFPLTDCWHCGAKATDRHHIDGNPTNNDPSNVMCLCRRCHMRTDGRLEKVQSWPKRKPFGPRDCTGCNKSFVGHMRRGLCNACYKRMRKAEACASFHEAKATKP